jgi:hypothetical protein
MVTSPSPKKTSGQAGQKHKINLLTRDNYIRIPLSGILIKFISLRPLRLCGEIIFGQE